MSHPDILEHGEPISRSLFLAVALHLAGVGAVAYSSWMHANVERFGSDQIGGGSVAITPVKSIGLPSRATRENRVANDTESQVPSAPKPEPKPAVQEDDREAVILRGRDQKKAKERKPEPVTVSRYKQPGSDAPNQVHSSTGAAAATQMYQAPGSGGVGVGAGSAFGGRFGYYEDLVRQRVGRNWRTQDVDARIQNAPRVIVTFDILRNGTLRSNSVSVVQRSGNPVLDDSCRRAILDAAPFDPLPAGFQGDSASVEFWFDLKR